MLPKVSLIGFHDQGNLGLGYLRSYLSRNGFEVETLDFRRGTEALIAALDASSPILIGFSIIFQFYIPDFSRLAKAIRTRGIRCHLTAGGHYPTLCAQDLFNEIPELDSIVRGEGEETLVELAGAIAKQRDWRYIDGLAHMQEGTCNITTARALIQDLDSLPHPDRSLESLALLGIAASPILASRGCPRACSFCSIRQFYKQSPGKAVRVRQPENVVAEMDDLYQTRGVRIFLFQDDDFPLAGVGGKIWLESFLHELKTKQLAGNIIWKVSCRADEIKPELFRQMKTCGLFMVYLGLESGNMEGLRVLNKQLSVKDNLQAVATLKLLDLAMTYGFMLFDPSSSFDTLQENLKFLRKLVAIGNLPAIYCRMLPYAGTEIARQLAAEGRLCGDHINPDYAFKDRHLNDCYSLMNPYIQHWMQGSRSLSSQLNWAWQEYWLIQRLFPPLEQAETYRNQLTEITAASNHFLLDFSTDCLKSYQSTRGLPLTKTDFVRVCDNFSTDLVAKRNVFVTLNQETLLATIDRLNAPRMAVSPAV